MYRRMMIQCLECTFVQSFGKGIVTAWFLYYRTITTPSFLQKITKILRFISRLAARTFALFLLGVLLLFGVLQIPSVQLRLVQYGIDQFENHYDLRLEIGSTRLLYPWKVTVNDLSLFTAEGDTVLVVPSLDIIPGIPQRNRFKLSLLRLRNPYALMYSHEEDTLNNWQKVMQSIIPEEPNPDLAFEIGALEITQGTFIKSATKDELQHDFKNMTIRIHSFRYANEGVEARIDKISFASRRMNLYDLSGNFAYRKDQGVVLSRTILRTDESSMDADIYLDVTSNGDYKDFANRVTITTQINELTLSSSELRRYAPTAPDLGVLYFKGAVSGTMGLLKGTDVRLQYGHQTSLRGDLVLQNITSSDPLWIDVNLRYLRSNFLEFSTLMTVLANEKLAFVEPYINTFAFSGHFSGTRDDFSSEGTLHTDIGTFDLALNIEADNRPLVEADFSGHVNGNQVKIGQLLQVPDLADAAFSVDVKGHGLSTNTLDMFIKGRASAVVFRGYTYNNVRLDGRMQALYFNGKIAVDDPNLQMNFDGSALLEPGNLQLDFLSYIEHADLYKLGFTSVDSTYSIQADAIVNVAQTNDWVGEVSISNAFIERSHRVYFFRDIRIASFEIGQTNILSVHSDFINGRLSGVFQIPEIYKALYNVAASYSSYIEPLSIREHIAFSGNIETGDSRLITDLLLPQVEVYPGANITIDYASEQVTIKGHIPGLRIGTYDIQGIDVTLSSTHGSYMPVDLEVEKVLVGDWEWENVNVKPELYPDSLVFDVRTRFEQGGGGNIHLLGAAIQRDTAVFDMQLLPSAWNIGGGVVNIEPNNQVRWVDGAIRVKNLNLESDGRRMRINGNVSASPYEILRVQVDSFSVDAFNFLLEPRGFALKGILEGEMIFNSLLGEPRFASDMRIDSLFINDYWQGDFFLDSEWYINEQFVDLDVHLDRGQLRTLEVSGSYFPENEDDKLRADLAVNRFRIRPLTPLFSSFTDNVRGVASGNISLTGTVGKPVLEGRLTVPNLGLSIPFLNTQYNLQGAPEIIFHPEQIIIPNAQIVDTKEGTTGIARADLRHRYFSDWQVDVHIDADRLLALNTNAVLNDYFYGKVFVSGDIDIKGPSEELRFDINVTTHRGTEFFIPVDGPTDVNPMGFVEFVVKEEERKAEERSSRATGLNLQINIDVTPDAEVHLIMDQRTGETIKGNGRGRLRFNLDPQGNIGLFGNLEVNRGEYMFTLGGLVRKRFFIEPGGSISFNGDPYEAVLDLSTKYVTRTSLSGAVADPTLAAVRTEVNLYLKLSAMLTKPEISFDIKLPNVAPGIQAEVNDRFSDPNRLTQQAFSLLALNSFYTDDLALDAQVQGGLASTTIDVFAGQVNNFLSQYIKIIDIAVNYTGEGITGASQEEFEVAVSRRLFDDRISINGVVGVPLGANQNQLAGDVEVDMMLTQDGRVRAKAFNRSYQNNLLIEQTGLYSQGVGLFYRTDFNRRRELLKRLMFFRKE